MLTTPNRNSRPWRDFLNSEEAEELAKLDARAAEIDRERRGITAELNLLRSRAIARRVAAERKVAA